MPDFSIVQYFGSGEGHECGYCHASSDGRVSHGLWAHNLAPANYQAMIDRGWRRSGQYCYKPIMKSTCCPQYTIRCDVTVNTMTKSQKRALVAFSNYILKDQRPKERSQGEDVAVAEGPNQQKGSKPAKKKNTEDVVMGSNLLDKPVKSQNPQKMRFQRYRRRVDKLKAKKGYSDEQITAHFAAKLETKLKKNRRKTVDDYLNLLTNTNTAHKFELKLVKSSDLIKNKQLKTEEHELYMKYQAKVHGDDPSECNMKQFERFLVKSPLFEVDIPNSPYEMGSYHQQYRIDGKLVAVGVVDILSKCLSSVYLFYDPQYSFLSLGRVSALQEISLTRKILAKFPQFKYYYMGFYIHDCPKMNYKGAYRGSDLLCPEVFTWHSLTVISTQLDNAKYCRFSDPSLPPPPPVKVGSLLVLYQHTAMPYRLYALREATQAAREQDELTEFANLMGEDSLKDLLLVRETSDG